MKYVFANTTAQREEKLNPHANTPAAVKMNEINPKYERHRLRIRRKRIRSLGSKSATGENCD